MLIESTLIKRSMRRIIEHMTVIAFPGHAGRCWLLARWRSLARIAERTDP